MAYDSSTIKKAIRGLSKPALGVLRYALTLGLFSDGTATAKIVSNVVFNSWAFNSDKNADAGVTANFENGDGSAPVLTWSV